MVDGLTIVILGLSVTISNFYLVLAAVLAAEFENRNLQPYYYGFIIGAYAFASIIATFFVSWFIEKLGRGTVIYLGVFMMGVCSICLGLVTYIENNLLMVAAIILFRWTQGISRVFIIPASWSILVILHPDEPLKYIGYIESGITIGIGLGPAIGSILYNFFGYFYMFLIASLFVFIYIPLIMIFKPSDIDKNDETTSLNKQIKSQEDIQQKISFSKVFWDRFIIICSLNIFTISVWYAYFEPILSFRVHEFTDSIYVQGLVFSSLPISYSLMGIFIPYLAKCINLDIAVIVGLFLVGFSNFLIGPSTLLPNSLALIIVGLCLLGSTIATANIPIVPMMIEYAGSKYPYEKRKAADLWAAIYYWMCSSGQ